MLQRGMKMRNSKANKSKKTKYYIFIAILFVIGILAYAGSFGFKSIAGYRVKLLQRQ
jgi:flagellar basal body-associated protein FliL